MYRLHKIADQSVSKFSCFMVTYLLETKANWLAFCRCWMKLRNQSASLGAWVWIVKFFFTYFHFAHFAWLKMLQSNGHKGTEMFCICLFKDGVTIIGNIKYLAIQIRDWSLNSRCILSDVLANYWAVQTLYSSKMPPLRKTTDFFFLQLAAWWMMFKHANYI